ncbi:MAG: hypothetical protein BWY32_03474 [bacterium ADurb.Bin243]|nr:MAG: hypothetical protein BWY32_03474 [bacterium ADurb.Bin243]
MLPLSIYIFMESILAFSVVGFNVKVNKLLLVEPITIFPAAWVMAELASVTLPVVVCVAEFKAPAGLLTEFSVAEVMLEVPTSPPVARVK